MKEINLVETLRAVFEFTEKLLPKTTEKVGNLLLDKIYELWVLTARTKPTTTKGAPSRWGERYSRAIEVEPITPGGGKGRVYIDDGSPEMLFVNMVESGVRSWSIKDALLKGKAARRNKELYGNTFVTVPFRQRTPGGRGPASSSFAGDIPSDVYERAKRGESIGPEAGKLAGLTRVGGSQHSQFFTFRTVSENSPGWVYPSVPATPVFEEVQAEADTLVEGFLEKLVAGFAQDMKKEFER